APKGLKNRRISAMAEDRDGNLLVGMNEQLFKLKCGSQCGTRECAPEFIPFLKDATSKVVILVMYADREGALWIGTNFEGMLRYKDGQVTTYTTKNGLANDSIRGFG